MKYDDAEYFFLNFEDDDLATENGATHIGLYLAWNAMKGLVSTDTHDQAVIDQVRSRSITGRDFVVDQIDCKLFDDDLNDEGNAFAAWYYEDHYVQDYCRVFGVSDDVNDFCSVEDSWANYDKLAPVLDQRFAEWKAQA